MRCSTLSDSPKDINDAKQGMDSCCGYIRKLIGQRVALRYTPEFQFIYDKGTRYAAEIDKALMDIQNLTQQERRDENA